LPLKSLHGVVWLLNRGWIIQLNSRDSRRVRRYSLFHEAFHIACRITCPACDKIEVRRTSFTEVLADHFAACFLMPKEWVEECWPKVRDVRAMADRFDVPLSQMRRRIKQLNLLQSQL
jgi:Zn-dependent peptidase ImmA (M78 family)